MNTSLDKPTGAGPRRSWPLWAVDIGIYVVGVNLSVITGATLSGLLASHPWIQDHWPWAASHANPLGGAYTGLLLVLLMVSIHLGRSAARREGQGAGWRRTFWHTFFKGSVLAMIAATLGGTALGFTGMPFHLAFMLTLLPLAPLGAMAAAGRARAQYELLEEREKNLQARLAPHFMLNALSTLKAQIAADPLEAQATVDRLARLVQELMEMATLPSVPLGRELSFTEAWLGLEKSTLGERLQVEIDVPEELEECPVPPLSLQVLVENAVKHGVAPLPRGGRVRIRAERAPAGLRLLVDDPGDGRSERRGNGLALELLRQRIARPQDLSMAPLAGGGHRVELLLRNR